MTALLLPELLSEPFSAPAVTATLLVGQPAPPEDPGGQGEDFGKSSPVGLVVLLLFFVAVLLLVRSMNKHLRRVPESFDKPPDQPPDQPLDKLQPFEKSKSIDKPDEDVRG
jgi:hypothetical protein